MAIMTPDEISRAGDAVAARMRHLGLSLNDLAERAGIDRGTLSALLHGRRWPQAETRARICRALGWETGTISRARYGPDALADFTTAELLREALRRVGEQP